MKKGDPIDYRAGLVLKKKIGEPVKKGEVIAELRSSTTKAAGDSVRRYLEALTFSEEKPELKPLIRARVTAEGVSYYR